MRFSRMWMAATVALVAFSGCLDDNDTASTDAADTDPAAGTNTTADLPAPRNQTLSCEALPGAPGLTVAGVGGCTLGEVEFDGIAVMIDAAPGCTVAYDENDDNFTDGEVAEGSKVRAGWSLNTYCQITGGTGGQTSVTVEEELEEPETMEEDETA